METPRVFQKDDHKRFLNFLQSEGYVVIGDILEDETRSKLIDKFWEAWEYCSPRFKRDDKKTWTIQNCPMMFAKGMAVFSGLAHSDFMWETRLQKPIREVFEVLHGTKDLVVSFDGFSVFLSDKQKPKNWLHTDQNPNNTMYSIQGAYNFFPVKENSSGFVVVPKSHLREIETDRKGDWVPIENETGFVKLIIPGNCLVLWNSKTIHANTGMDKGTPLDKSPDLDKSIDLDRLTCYITYMPKSTRPTSVLFQKMIAYLKGDGTSHWANRCEVKKYPWGFGPGYESKNFNCIKPESSHIPKERFDVM